MSLSPNAFKISIIPLRGWPVRGLHVLASPFGEVPGVIFANEQTARRVQQSLDAMGLDSKEFLSLCADPSRLREFLFKLFPELAENTVPPDVTRFLQILEDLGWSQAKLARKLQLDPNTVSRWVTGRTPVPTWALEYLTALKAIKDLVKTLDLC